jgi:hypothetical protein
MNSQTYNQLLNDFKKISSFEEEKAFEEKLRLQIFQQSAQEDQAQLDFLAEKLAELETKALKNKALQ